MTYRDQIPASLSPIIQAISQAGGTPVIVGGYVRDLLLGIPSTDMDIEVFGVADYDTLCAILSPFSKPHLVGRSFGVVQIDYQGYHIDFSLPRHDNKVGTGHKGFQVTYDPNASFEVAASRRDFTINSMGIDLLTGELLDPFNGQKDLKNRILRATSTAFEDDSLRVLRALQFAARFSLTIDPNTCQRCSQMSVSDLPRERLFDELKKLLCASPTPSWGLKYIPQLGLSDLFSELIDLKNINQDPEWHPEGDVWTHTLLSLDCMATLAPEDINQKLIFMLAILCHDFGKAKTTEFLDGRWRSLGHEKEGGPITIQFLAKFTDQKSIINPVVALVLHHLRPALLYKSHLQEAVTDAAIRRLALKVPITDLILLARADYYACSDPPNMERPFPAGDWLLERATQLSVKNEAPQPLLKGQHLLALGVTPGPSMGDILKQAFSHQLDGQIHTEDEAIEWAKQYLQSSGRHP